MSESDTGHASSQRGRIARTARRAWHWLLVTLSVRPDPDREVIRAVTLIVVVGASFAISGVIRQSAVASYFVEAPIDLDHSLRALSLGWFASDKTIPVTIVDIDERTNRDWNSPAITPRDKLVRMLEVVTAASPIAVVVDIDLSWGERVGADDKPQRALLVFLEQYRGPTPLIFPKRIEPSPEGPQRAAASPFDEVFEKSSWLSWAHASFETDAGGAVRNWHEWLGMCTSSGVQWLPSVPVRLAAVVETLPAGLDRPDVTTAHGADCNMAGDESGSQVKRLLIGPRMTGNGRSPPQSDAQAISASLLLDPEISRDDDSLFSGRVVFIGATHAGAGDFWLTPSGVLPGVELLANIVRYAPLQAETNGGKAGLAFRPLALLLFVVFAGLQWWLRGVSALVLATLFTLGAVAIAVERYDNFGVFEAVEAAILMMILYKAAEFLLEYVDEVKAAHARLAPGPWRWLRTLRAAIVREHESSPGGG